MKITGRKVPDYVYSKSLYILKQFKSGIVRSGKTYQHGYLYLKVNAKWRLLSKNGGSHWEIMSHEKFNNEIKG